MMKGLIRRHGFSDTAAAEASQRMDFTKEDATDDLQLNEVIWRSVRGAGSPMPPPHRAAFVFTRAEEKEKDKGCRGESMRERLCMVPA